MADLSVDYAVLQRLKESLYAVAREFEDMHKRRDDEKHIWGGPSIRNGMDDFASNWDRHRENLTGEIQQLGEKCGGVVAVFHGVDEAMARGAGGE